MAARMRIIKNILIGASLVIVSGCATVEEKQNVSNPASAYTDDVFILSTSADLAYQENRWIDAVRLYKELTQAVPCLLYTSPSPRDGLLSRMPSSA